MDDLVERLQDAGYVLVSPGFRKLAHEAAARIEYLGKRLEVVPGWSESADGISCRDDTIKLQDARIQALEASLAEAEGRVKELESLLRIEREHRNAPGPF